MRRLLWLGVGSVVTVAALRRAREVADRHVPAGARRALGAAASLTMVAQRAAAEFRAATAEREAELRADLLAGADLPRSRARVQAWRAERAERAERGDADRGPDVRVEQPGAVGPTSAAARPGSAAASRRGGSHRAEDPDDGSLGYSFF